MWQLQAVRLGAVLLLAKSASTATTIVQCDRGWRCRVMLKWCACSCNAWKLFNTMQSENPVWVKGLLLSDFHARLRPTLAILGESTPPPPQAMPLNRELVKGLRSQVCRPKLRITFMSITSHNHYSFASLPTDRRCSSHWQSVR
jgi:hypothetical protein